MPTTTFDCPACNASFTDAIRRVIFFDHRGLIANLCSERCAEKWAEHEASHLRPVQRLSPVVPRLRLRCQLGWHDYRNDWLWAGSSDGPLYARRCHAPHCRKTQFTTRYHHPS